MQYYFLLTKRWLFQSIVRVTIATLLAVFIYPVYAAETNPFDITPSASKKEKKFRRKIDFDLDYVGFKKYKIPTQEIFANELCLFIATLYRRLDLEKVPPASLDNTKFYLAGVYRSTRNPALKTRLKEAVKILCDFQKSEFELDATLIPEDKNPTVERLATELCMFVAILGRQQELSQINKKILTRTFLYLSKLAPQIKQQELKQRIRFVEGYIKDELRRRTSLKKATPPQGSSLNMNQPPLPLTGTGPLPPPQPQRGTAPPSPMDDIFNIPSPGSGPSFQDDAFLRDAPSSRSTQRFDNPTPTQFKGDLGF